MALRTEPVPGTSTTLVGGFEDKLLICRAEKTTVGETSCNQTKEVLLVPEVGGKRGNVTSLIVNAIKSVSTRCCGFYK